MHPVVKKPRIFEAQSFATMKEWVYFCVEFDLQVCPGCQCKSRRRPSAEDEYVATWYCQNCKPPIHPDLADVLQQQSDKKTCCDLCGRTVPVKDCWISDDCQRLYCASHLEPVRVEDRYRMARQYLQRWFSPKDRTRKEGVGRLTSVTRAAAQPPASAPGLRVAQSRPQA